MMNLVCCSAGSISYVIQEHIRLENSKLCVRNILHGAVIRQAPEIYSL